MKRIEAIRSLVNVLGPRDLVVCSNGMMSRELYTVAHRLGNFYMIGSMGLALSIGIGLARAQPKKRVVVLEGDGNALMGLSSMASAASMGIGNMLHVVLDNEAYGSTGGQPTISMGVSLDRTALALGYSRTYHVYSERGFESALESALGPPNEGPVMVLCKVEPWNHTGVGRVEIKPEPMAETFAIEARS